MIRTFIFCITTMLVSQSIYATTHIINQVNNTFSPIMLNVMVGDIVEWQWSSGAHTTTSISVPAGAAGWDEPLTSQNSSFQYTVTVAGTYAYVCSLHLSVNMAGAFVASTPNAITENTSESGWIVSVSEDASTLHVVTAGMHTSEASFVLIDITGKVLGTIYKGSIQNGDVHIRYDVSGLQRGFYFVCLYRGNHRETKKIVVG